jgi:type VI secretion system secreted protein VgrG
VQYRPARITPKPVVQGPQTAIVVGKSGEEIWTDELGRVKLQFHWDRYGQADENSSCWVRVAQVWAGNKWGGMLIPRLGQEVIVEFLEGDPDRPIVTGRVYNGDAKPPYDLPNEATKSTLKSNSSKDGGGFNELRFEDKKGDEQVFIHGEKDMDVRAKNDSKEFIGRDRHLIVKRNKLDRIDGNHHHGVGGDELIKVTGNQGSAITGDRMVNVTGDDNLSVTGNHKQQTTGDVSVQTSQNLYEKAGMNHGLEAGMNIHLKGGMNVVIEAGMSITLKAGGGFVVVGPAGVAISGTPVLINSGGAAGSGSGCSPVAPDAPDAVKYPLEADDGTPGQSDEAAEADAPPEPTQFSPSAQKMMDAAANGDAFCDSGDGGG